LCRRLQSSLARTVSGSVTRRVHGDVRKAAALAGSVTRHLHYGLVTKASAVPCTHGDWGRYPACPLRRSPQGGASLGMGVEAGALPAACSNASLAKGYRLFVIGAGRSVTDGRLYAGEA